MKKILLLLVVLGFLKGEVKAQAVEWVKDISGSATLTYIKDNMIYMTTESNLSILNSRGEVLRSKNTGLSTSNESGLYQRFRLSNNRILFSSSNIILDSNLNVNNATSNNSNRLISPNLDVYTGTYNFHFNSPGFFLNIYNSNNSKLGSNTIYRDMCFYNNDCFGAYEHFDSENTLYFSRCNYKALNKGSNCNVSSNYIPTNTVGGVVTTYNSQLEGAQQSIMSLDKMANVRLLPLYKPNYKSDDYFFPINFDSDEKGNLFVYSIDGVVGKYKINPWDSIWTKKLPNLASWPSQIYNDKKSGRIYVMGKSHLTVGYSSFYILDSIGNIMSSKSNPNWIINNFEYDNKQSIYISGVTARNYPINNKLKILDCYTLTGNFIAKLYTGTIPSTPKLTQSGLVLKSNFPRGVTWYRNDSLLTSENDTFTLALRDGKYTFKAFCKQDTLNFKGISYPNGSLQTITIPGATYQWFLNDVSIPNAITNIYKPTSVGKYTVKINFDKIQALFSSGRSSSTNAYQAFYSLNLIQLSVENNDSQTASGYFTLYPNPATQTLTIKTAGFTQVPQAQILNALGQEVTSLYLASELSSVDVSSFPKGIYSIKVGSQVQKLVVE